MRSYITPPTIFLKNQEGESLLFMQLNKLEEKIQKNNLLQPSKRSNRNPVDTRQVGFSTVTMRSLDILKWGVAGPWQGLEETVCQGLLRSESRGD